MSDFDVTPVVWRVTAVPEDSHPDFSYDLDGQYRLDDGEWQLLSSDGWHKSQWSGLGEMVDAGYVLEAEPDPDPVPAVSEQTAPEPVCVCDHVDIGIGCMKVNDDPSCLACHPADEVPAEEATRDA